METFSTLLALCAGNSPITGEFPAQWPVTRSFDAFFDLRLHKRLSKQSWGWWFETPSRSLWRHCNASCGILVIGVVVLLVIFLPKYIRLNDSYRYSALKKCMLPNEPVCWGNGSNQAQPCQKRATVLDPLPKRVTETYIFLAGPPPKHHRNFTCP